MKPCPLIAISVFTPVVSICPVVATSIRLIGLTPAYRELPPPLPTTIVSKSVDAALYPTVEAFATLLAMLESLADSAVRPDKAESTVVLMLIALISSIGGDGARRRGMRPDKVAW